MLAIFITGKDNFLHCNFETEHDITNHNLTQSEVSLIPIHLQCHPRFHIIWHIVAYLLTVLEPLLVSISFLISGLQDHDCE